MIEGTNNPVDWINNIKMIPNSDAAGSTQYGNVGYRTPQFVRILLVKVTDMGDGLGTGKSSAGARIQMADALANYRENAIAGSGSVIDLGDRHLLAPSLGEIFDNVLVDPHGNYQDDPTDASLRSIQCWNPDMIGWKYTTNSPADGIPIAAQSDLSDPEAWDPLRSTKRSRKFHVLKDKTIAFQASGSLASDVNQQGAKRHLFKYSYMIKNQRCQMETIDDIYDTPVWRAREFLKDRYIWYFIPSISPFQNGSILDNNGTGMHAFYVTRGEEKVSWTEKDDY